MQSRAASLVVSIPPDTIDGGIEITMYSPKESPTTIKEMERESVISRLFSIRTIFAIIFLLTCAACVVLIVVNHSGQLEIVERDTQYKLSQVNEIIIHNIDDIFFWMEMGLLNHENLFYFTSTPPNGTNVALDFPHVGEYLFSAALGQPVSTVLELDLPDGRILGVTGANNRYSVYTVDFVNTTDGSESMWFNGWTLNVSLPLVTTNFSLNNTVSSMYMPPPYPLYSFMQDPTRDYLKYCDSPIYWEGVYGSLGIQGIANDVSMITTYVGADKVACNQYGEIIGYMYFGVSIDSFDLLLKDLADENAGLFVIVDNNLNIIASSTGSPTFEVISDDTLFDLQQLNVTTTQERWIKDAVKVIDGDFSNYNRIVSINHTKFYLSVQNWKQFPNTNWTIILLLDYNFLLASTPSTIRRSIIISVVIVAVIAVAAFAASYYTTALLVRLAKNMKKIAALDLDSAEDLKPPGLIEIKRLYHSYLGMNAALRSFKKFVPTQIVSKIIRSKKEVAAELKFRYITIMFQDIAGFTTLSETMNPTTLAKLTSEYMGVMTKIICKNGGTIDKYVGDCIMSLFNAPEEVDNHPTAAATSAVECIQAVMEKNKEWIVKYGVEMNFRSGIHSGEVLIGNMGSDHRMTYTAFGDNVNIAARLEGVNKLFGSQILVSKAVHANFPKDVFVTRKLGKIRVSGKSVATTVYEVVGNVTPTKVQLIEHYEKALLAAKDNNLDEALTHLEEALTRESNDKATLHLKGRIIEAKENNNWSYIEDLVKY